MSSNNKVHSNDRQTAARPIDAGVDTDVTHAQMREILGDMQRYHRASYTQISATQMADAQGIFVESFQRCAEKDHAPEKILAEVIEKVGIVSGDKQANRNHRAFRCSKILNELVLAPINREYATHGR